MVALFQRLKNRQSGAENMKTGIEMTCNKAFPCCGNMVSVHFGVAPLDSKFCVTIQEARDFIEKIAHLLRFDKV